MTNKDSDYYKLIKKFHNNSHRDYVGGKWCEIGKLQFNFLKAQGLMPNHKLIDVGCGSLRGGVHFIKYLNKYNYYGTDLTIEIINAGIENELSGEEKEKIDMENFCISSHFKFNFDVTFDFGIAFSLFTHLKKNNIELCLKNLHNLFSTGTFYATFFTTKNNYNILKPVNQKDGVVTYYNKDPYHYSIDDIKEMAFRNNWNVRKVPGFTHPRNQKIFEFKK